MTNPDQERECISREDYYQLIGLLTLATEYNQRLLAIERAACEITKDEDMGHTSDAVFQGYAVDKLLKLLGIEVADD
jgi:hypothetical protein